MDFAPSSCLTSSKWGAKEREASERGSNGVMVIVILSPLNLCDQAATARPPRRISGWPSPEVALGAHFGRAVGEPHVLAECGVHGCVAPALVVHATLHGSAILPAASCAFDDDRTT